MKLDKMKFAKLVAHKAEMELASTYNFDDGPLGFDGPTAAD